MIRRTSNNLFPYRFFISTDVEFSYLAKILGAKSSSFEFALDSAEPVRQFYLKELEKHAPSEGAKTSLSAARLQSILGDLYASEQRYDKAIACYSDTIYKLKTLLRSHNGDDWKSGGGPSFETHLTLINTLLKKGNLEEIRENTSLALTIYTEAQKLSMLQFGKHTGDKVYEHQSLKTMLLGKEHQRLYYKNVSRTKIATLAINFVQMKTGEKVNLQANEFETYIKKDSSNYDVSFITKAFSFLYYTSDYTCLKCDLFAEEPKFQGAFKKFHKDFSYTHEGAVIWKREQFDKYDASAFLFIYGQSLFSAAAKNLKTRIKELSKKSKHGKTDVRQEFLKEWKAIVLVFSSTKYKLSDLRFYSEKSTIDGVNKTNSRLLVRSFYYLFASADSAKKKGKHADAAHKYTSILLNWIALLEILPWENIKNIDVDLDTMKKIVTKPSWLSDVILNAQECVEKADRSSNVLMREIALGYFKEADISESESTIELHENSLRASNILERCTQSSPEGNNSKYSFLVWCRSNISNYLLIFGLWESYCRYSIGVWWNYSKKTEGITKEELPVDFDLTKVPVPIGNLPRVHAIYLWLLARQKMHKLIGDKAFVGNYEIVTGDSNYSGDISKIISITSHLVQALHEYRKAFRSDDPDSFPSKTHIIFNLRELRKFIDNAKNSREVDEALKKQLRERNDGESKLRTNNKKFETTLTLYLNQTYLDQQLEKYGYDLHDIHEVTSQSFRKKVRHKYFLYDDYEDPFYISEWAFLRMMSSTIPLLFWKEKHRNKICKFRPNKKQTNKKLSSSNTQSFKK